MLNLKPVENSINPLSKLDLFLEYDLILSNFLMDIIRQTGSVFLEELNWVGQTNLQAIIFTDDISISS